MLLAAVMAFADLSPPALPTDSATTGLISQDDYPPASLRNGEQGLVVMRVTVDADGKVAACTIASSSGFPRLDAKSCDILRQRGHYLPARDTSGKAIADTVTARIKWVIPEELDDMADVTAVNRIALDQNHHVIGCAQPGEAMGSGGPVPDACRRNQRWIDQLAAQGFLNDVVAVVDRQTVDFEPEAPANEEGAPVGGVVVSDDVALFTIGFDGREYLRCVRVTHEGAAASINLCEAPPFSMPATGYASGVARSGTMRRTIWVIGQP